MGFPGGSVIKNLSSNAGDGSSVPGSGRCPGEWKAPHSSIVAWEISWTEEPGGLLPMGSRKRVGHDLPTKITTNGGYSEQKGSEANHGKWGKTSKRGVAATYRETAG